MSGKQTHPAAIIDKAYIQMHIRISLRVKGQMLR